MTITEYANLFKKFPKEVSNLINKKMPVIVGEMAKSHYTENFDKSGFVNNGLHQWKPAKRIGQGKGAGNSYKTLTSDRNRLMNSIKYIPGEGKVIIRNDVEYAAIHNEGGTVQINPTVTPKMKKFAWAKYYEAMGGKKQEKGATIPEDAARWRGLALTKKTKLTIKAVMPKRQFIGESKELDNKISNKLESELRKILNS